MKAHKAIFDAIKVAGGVSVGCSTVPNFFKVAAFGSAGKSDRDWWGLCIDTNVGLYFKGSKLLVPERLSYCAIRHNAISVIPEGIASVLGILKEILNNSAAPSKFHSSSIRAVQNEWDTICWCLEPMGAYSKDSEATNTLRILGPYENFRGSSPAIKSCSPFTAPLTVFLSQKKNQL